MNHDPNLSELFEALSEESLFKLLNHVEARLRRQVLKGDKDGDVDALRTLHSALEMQHSHKLDDVLEHEMGG